MSMESINLRTRRGWGLPIGALAAWSVAAVGSTVWAYDHDRNNAPVRADYDGSEVVVEDGAHLKKAQGAASRCGEAVDGFTAQPEAVYVDPQDQDEILSYVLPSEGIVISDPNTCDTSTLVIDADFVGQSSTG